MKTLLKRITLFSLVCLNLAALAVPAHASKEGIAAVVNQDVISMTDFNDRLKLIAVSSGLPDRPEVRERLSKQVMDILIDEQLMLQEAAKRNITVTDVEIDQGFASLAQQNKTDPETFAKAVAASGINPATMRRQIRAQMAWSKVIQKVMRPKVVIMDADIDEYLNRISSGKGQEEYLLAEIVLPVKSQDQEAPAQQLGERLAADVRAGKAPFSRAAQQFSSAPGAAQGGDMGWLRLSQAPQEFAAQLPQAEKNSVLGPVRTKAGYHLLLLRDKRVITDETLPSREDVLSTLGVQRLERMQRGYLMDLKSAAFIENRVQS